MTAETKLTKRARRILGGNPSQSWPQMPKIQSSAARSNAYLRVAGLNNGTKIKTPALDPSLDLMNSPEVKFGRLLGSTDQRIRHEAVKRLGTYLTDRCAIGEKEGMGLSELDLLKLWKGLWYTLYMADRVPVQDELSKHLAELIWCVAGTEEEDEYAGKTYLDMYGDNEDDDDYDDEDIVMEEISNTLDHASNADCNHDDESEDESDDGKDDEPEDGKDDDEEECGEEDDEDENNGEERVEDDDELTDAFIPHCRGAHLAALFIKTFFQTVRREWGRMDKYRVDKFYTLIRLMMEQVYSYMAKRHWNLGIIRLFNDTIHEEILSQTPNGLRLHLVDLSMNELAKVNAKAPMPLTEATIVDVLEPFFALAQACDDKIVQGRVVVNIFYKFLNEYSVVCEAAVQRKDEDDKEKDEENLIMDHVHVGTIADIIFGLASDGATRNDYRESLYTTYKDFKRRLKLVGNDVVLDLEEEEEHDEIEDDDAVSDTEQVRVIEVDDPINFKEPVESSKSNKKDTKSNKKDTMKRKHDVIEDSPQIETKDLQENPDNTKAKKKRKKKKGKVHAEGTSSEAEEINVTPSKIGSKKMKTDNAEQETEEVISISVADQKRAKQSMKDMEDEDQQAEEPTKKKKNKKKSRKEKESDENVEEGSRRVSFGKVNHSKSHKASMRALKTMEIPKPGPVTPDKSILRKKSPTAGSSEGAGKKQKKGRKAAVDYF